MYILLDGYRPIIKKCIRVLRDRRYKVDLLLGEHMNVWEHKDRVFTGKLQLAFWDKLERFFDVEIVPQNVLTRLNETHAAYIEAAKEAGVPHGLELMMWDSDDLYQP